MVFSLIQSIGVTLLLALSAAVLGLMGGLFIGIITSKQLRNRVSFLADGYMLIMRGTPLFVQLLLVYYVLPDLIGISLSPLTAGVIALGLNEAAYTGAIIKGGLNTIQEEQWQAAQVLGYHTFTTLKDIMLPQVFRSVMPALSNELALIIKDTSLVSAIGLIEITQIGKNLVATTLRPLEIYVAIALIYLVITTVITQLTNYISKRLL